MPCCAVYAMYNHHVIQSAVRYLLSAPHSLPTANQAKPESAQLCCTHRHDQSQRTAIHAPPARLSAATHPTAPQACASGANERARRSRPCTIITAAALTRTPQNNRLPIAFSRPTPLLLGSLAAALPAYLLPLVICACVKRRMSTSYCWLDANLANLGQWL